MKVLVIGAAGFVGSRLVKELLDSGHSVRCVARTFKQNSGLPLERLEPVVADIRDIGRIAGAFADVDAAINLVNLLDSPVSSLLPLAQTQGLRRFIFFGSTAMFTTTNAATKTRRAEQEQRIQDSTIPWTIVRPTLIYGGRRDRNISRLIGFLNKTRVLPIPGNGKHLQQPVYVGDVVNAITAILRSPETVRSTYNLPGAEPITFDDMVKEISHALGRRIIRVHVPIPASMCALRWATRLHLRLAIKEEQIIRLNEDKVFDYARGARDFGYQPVTFPIGLRLQMAEGQMEYRS